MVWSGVVLVLGADEELGVELELAPLPVEPPPEAEPEVEGVLEGVLLELLEESEPDGEVAEGVDDVDGVAELLLESLELPVAPDEGLAAPLELDEDGLVALPLEPDDGLVALLELLGVPDELAPWLPSLPQAARPRAIATAIAMVVSLIDASPPWVGLPEGRSKDRARLSGDAERAGLWDHLLVELLLEPGVRELPWLGLVLEPDEPELMPEADDPPPEALPLLPC